MNVSLDVEPMSGAWSKSFATSVFAGTPEYKQNNSSGLISELILHRLAFDITLSGLYLRDS